MTLSAKQAAEQVGMTKQAVINAIKDGRISAEKDNKGRWIIQPSELFRVFSPTQPLDTIDSNKTLQSGRNFTPEIDSNLPIENIKLRLELEAAQKEIKRLEEQSEELRDERNEWRQQAKRLSLAKPEDVEKAPQKPVEGSKGFLRIFSRKKP